MRSILVALLLLVATASEAANRVWITEFATTRPEAAAPFAQLPAIVHQAPLTITNLAPVTSQPFNVQTRYIRVICEVQCSIRVGSGAAQTDMMLPAIRPEYFGVQGGKTISVIANP
jgi:hypothetical protein